ncbi:hypothetical protein JYK22_38710, partial [Nonomuraea sp. RK-328]|nr:hypothetical protein [Nonomuraea sp. RK-328]
MDGVAAVQLRFQRLEVGSQVRQGQPVPNTMGKGRQGIIDPRDVAEVAVTALTSDEHVRPDPCRRATGEQPTAWLRLAEGPWEIKKRQVGWGVEW